MIMSAENKIHVKLIHHLFKACVHIVLDIRICRVLCHCLCGFMMRHDQPVILSCILACRRSHCCTEVLDHCLSFGIFLSRARNTCISCILFIIAARICTGVQRHKKYIIIKIIIISFCLHLAALCEVILSFRVRRHSVGLRIVRDLIRCCLDIISMTLACPVVLSAECCFDLLQLTVIVDALHCHLIGQIEVVCKHVMSVVISHCRGVRDRGHLRRRKERGVLAGFSPALILHLVSGRHNKVHALLCNLLHHGSPSGLVCPIR